MRCRSSKKVANMFLSQHKRMYDSVTPIKPRQFVSAGSTDNVIHKRQTNKINFPQYIGSKKNSKKYFHHITIQY